jgi:hypothetical protein
MEPSFRYNKIPIFNKDTLIQGYFQHNVNKINEIIGIDAKINEVLVKYPKCTVKIYKN